MNVRFWHKADAHIRHNSGTLEHRKQEKSIIGKNN